jgi:putative addiction module CopG family antidote
MTNKMAIIVGRTQQNFINSQIAKGRHASVDEAGREGIDLLQKRQRHLERLLKLIAEGDASADFQEVDFDALLADCTA